jgi:hypothetical protein
MMLPSTHDAVVEVFRIYNQAIWPAQAGAYLLGALAVLTALRPRQAADRLTLSVLAATWIWTGILYQGMFFSAINGAAVAFGIGVVLQGGLFVRVALGRATPRRRSSGETLARSAGSVASNVRSGVSGARVAKAQNQRSEFRARSTAIRCNAENSTGSRPVRAAAGTIWPDAQPWDTWILVAVAAVVVW